MQSVKNCVMAIVHFVPGGFMFGIAYTSGNSFGNWLIPYNSGMDCCPVCKTPHPGRIKRRMVDRLISRFIPLKRCYCEVCGWKGNLVRHK